VARVYLEQVSRRFKQAAAIEDITFEVPDGAFWVLVGPSGCGKSTILRMIAGLDTPTAGQIYIGDRQVNQVSARLRDVAMVFQNYALYPHMSVADNLAFGLRLRGTDRQTVQAQIEKTAKALNISHLLDRKPRQLSGGQQQRVALGRAIVRQPQVFLLDEPLSNLDAQLRDETRAELKQLHQQFGITTIYVTHDQVEAMTLADQIVVLQQGKIQQISDPQTLYTQPANQMVATFLGSPPMNILPARYHDAALQIGESWLPCPDRLQKILAAHGLTQVNLGIRPEQIRVAAVPFALDSPHPDPSPDPSSDPSSNALLLPHLTATVTVLEPLGRETLVRATVTTAAPLTLQLWAASNPALRVGQRLPLQFDLDQLLLFHPETGENLAVGSG
jgi:multiple sugar transport system ATP-binding protein